MVSAPNSLKPTGPTTKMMPEGFRKVCVLNDSRQIDQVTKGEWMMLKTLPESGPPGGIYQPGEVTRASSGKDAPFTGQVLLSDSKVVYQLPGRGVAEHPHPAFAELKAKGEKTVNGRSYIVTYVSGKGVASNAQTANVAQLRAISEGHGASM